MTRIFWFFFLFALAIYCAMLIWTVPPLLAEAEGLPPFDFRPTGYGLAETRAYLDAISEDGLAVYLGPQHMLDLFYPAVLAGMFVTGFAILFRRAIVVPLILVAVVGAVADYSENALVARILTEPDPSAGLIGRASLATVTKSVAGAICFTALILGGLRAGWRRLRRAG
ncbi:MAG: hypothetical protein ACU0DK_16850 [Pseudooceanicola sp.]